MTLQETDKKDMAGDVAAIDVAPVPPGRQRSRFLVVGSYDSTIRVLSLDPADTMKARAGRRGTKACLPAGLPRIMSTPQLASLSASKPSGIYAAPTQQTTTCNQVLLFRTKVCNTTWEPASDGGAASLGRPGCAACVAAVLKLGQPSAQVLATQQVASAPDSLLLLDSPEAGVDAGQEGAGTGSIFLHIGARCAPRLS